MKKLLTAVLFLAITVLTFAQVTPNQTLSNFTTNSPHQLVDANATWSSSVFTLSSYASTIVLVVYSDVSSATDGIVVKQSPSAGQNWIKIDKFSYTGGDKTTNVYYVPVQYKWIKVEYTNGATAQTVMELTTSFFTYPQAVKGL